MNALLASGEVPGLFEGEEYVALMAACRTMSVTAAEGSSSSNSSSSGGSAAVPAGGGGGGGREGGESEEELYRRFVGNVQRNLHVIFTMNPAGQEDEAFASRSSTSPALFNRCVVDWFGSWSAKAMAQVAYEFTLCVDFGGGGREGRREGGREGEGLLEVVRFLYEKDGEGEEEGEEEGGRTGATRSSSRGRSKPAVTSSSSSSSSSRGSKQQQQPTIHHAVIAALVATHQGVKRAVEGMGGRDGGRCGGGGRRHFLSPRDFLDLIRNFVSVVGEKRARLEEQQLHLNIGLEKLAATQTDVAGLQHALASKKEELKGKDALANEKLQQMVEDQNEAERKKTDADKVSRELARQNAAIATRREEVERELAEAEPALLAAQGAVKSIKKAHLDEVRVLVRPPNPVRLTLEAVLILLGEEKREWNDVRKVIRRDDFIATVVHFDPESITAKQVKDLTDNYLCLDEFDNDAVQRASTACGPLNKWVVSLLHYSAILRRVQPLREEVATLQTESDKLQRQQAGIEGEVKLLEASIAQYKAEYAQAIREIEGIKGEMDVVAGKVTRAEALLTSLASEKERWHDTSASFQRQLSSLVGDALLSAAFLTYAGLFDHRSRRQLLAEWSSALTALQVPFRPDLSPTDYLSRPAQQLEWASHGLPNDQLCVENAIILERAQHRYPLVVDPSGQATKFLLSKFAARKVQTTSFADGGFLKTLASAVRFGTPLLIQDVEESIDPLLNPVLNKELQRTGGRTLLRLGNEDIDFSPQFLVILVTRNPTARFPPDLCSRVTLVNFTVTPASLCSQALSQVLRAERPDVDRRRTEVLRLQGEQNVRLRELEEGLLTELSAVEGNILDDDRVLKALEGLKAEAAEVGRDVASTQGVMEELKATSDVYEPLALAVTQVFFLMARLSSVHFIYQYPIQYLLSILGYVLQANPPPSASTSASRGGREGGKEGGAHQRINTLKLAFFAEVCRRVAKGLLQEDQLAFAMRLTQIYLQGAGEGGDEGGDEGLGNAPTEVELECFYKGPAAAAAGGLVVGAAGGDEGEDDDEYLIPGVRLEKGQAKDLRALSLLPSLAGLLPSLRQNGKAWANLLVAARPEADMPAFDVAVQPPSSSSSSSSRRNTSSSNSTIQSSLTLPPAQRAFLHLLLLRALRPDRLIAAMELYVSSVLGEKFPWRGLFDLAAVVKEQSIAERPFLLCAEPGHDASGRVDALAEAEGGRGLRSVAMGSAEGYEVAERLITAGAQDGTWVLLRNIHLCPHWLEVLEKKLHKLSKPHPAFRLFLTSEIHPRLPPSLLRLSDVMVVEAPTGMKANVLRLLNDVPAGRMEGGCVEKARLFFLVAWFHALVHERLRYLPWGWSRRYEFSQADAQAALDVVEGWVEREGGKKGWHVSPEMIPWEAIRTLLSESVYGGRVENEFDEAVVEGFVSQFFRPECFDVDFPLVADRSVCLPEEEEEGREGGGRRAGYLAWLQQLPNQNSTTWLGLAPTVEAHLWSTIGARVAGKVKELQEDVRGEVGVEGGREEGREGEREKSAVTAMATVKMKALLQRVQGWLERVRPVALKLRTQELSGGRMISGSRSSSSSSRRGRGTQTSSSSSSASSSSSVSDGYADTARVRCLQREAEVGQAMLGRIEADLEVACEFLRGSSSTSSSRSSAGTSGGSVGSKGNKAVRSLVLALGLDDVPSEWKELHPRGKTSQGAGAWIGDTLRRVEHLQALLLSQENGGRVGGGVWLGGLYYPEAFVTATRQVVAARWQCSLEELTLAIELDDESSSNGSSGGEKDKEERENAFGIGNLTLEGASWEEGRLSLSSAAIRSAVPLAWICWHRVGEQQADGGKTKQQTGKEKEGLDVAAALMLPLYLDESRATLVAQVALVQQQQSSIPAHQLAQRGVALVAWRGVV